MAGSLHSKHGTGSNRAQKDLPPPGNKSLIVGRPTEARNGRGEEEEGGRKEEEEEQGLDPSPIRKRLKRGKGERGRP